MKREEYIECIQLTRQFAFCPNAFRVDLYKGCSFGCTYCYANMNWHEESNEKWKVAEFKKIEYAFRRALDRDKESKDILVELIRHRVPIHCGGMSDPFQEREWEYGLTYKLIELSNKYNYPILFSTKTDTLPVEYFKILNPQIHAFHVSILGHDCEYITKWEKNTPSATDRLQFVNTLKSEGFWCGIRIQPVIDIKQVEKLCKNIDNADYVTLEHLKLSCNIAGMKDFILSNIDNPQDFEIVNGKGTYKKELRIDNINRLKGILNNKGIPVGIGDNDLHYMSDTPCCCGLDTINANFKNYLKYNLTYMSIKGYNENTFIPQCNIRKNINDRRYGNHIDCKQYVDDYINRHLGWCGNMANNIGEHVGTLYQYTLF